MAVRLTRASAQHLSLSSAINYNAAYTVLLAIRPATVAEDQYWFSLYKNGSNYDAIYLNNSDSDRITFRQQSGSASFHTGSSPVAAAANTWVYIAAVRHSATSVQLYAGSSPENMASTGNAGTLADVSGRNATGISTSVGNLGALSLQGNGRVRYVRVYTSALSLADIKAAAGSPWAEWLLPDHTDITDSSGNGRDLTATGTPTTEDDDTVTWPESTGDATGSGAPVATLSESGSGVATQTFTGSGTPTETLGASGSGAASNPDVFASGTPTETLGASGSGAATQTFTGSGTPTETIGASGSGSGTNTPDEVGGATGSGTPTATIGASGSGAATQTFTGSGTPTETVGASGSGAATQTFTGSGTPTETIGASGSGAASNPDVFASGTPTETIGASGSGVATNLPGGVAPPTLVSSRFEGTNATALLLPATGTVDLVAGRLYLLAYGLSITTPPDLSSGYTVTHSGVDRTADWHFIAQTAAFSNNLNRRMAMYWYVPAANETDITITFDPAGTANNSINAGSLIEVASGFSAVPVVQSAVASTLDATSLSVSLASAPAVNSLSVAAFFNKDDFTDTVPRSGWTELSDDPGVALDTGALQVQYRETAEQTASASVVSGTRDWGGIHVEIRAFVAGVAVGDAVATLSADATGTATNTPEPSGLPFAPDPPAALRTINVSTQSQLVSAANNALPGDHIILAPGTYLGGVQMPIGVGGTEANPVVFQGPRTAIVDRGGNTAGFGFRVRGPYVQLRGFTVRNALFGIRVERGTGGPDPTDFVSDDLEVRDTGQDAYGLQGAHRSYVQRGWITNTGNVAVQFGEGIYVGHSSNSTLMSDDVKILGMQFGPDVSVESVDIKGLAANRSKRTLIQGNTVDATGSVAVDQHANGCMSDQGGQDTQWIENTITGITAPNLSGFFLFTSVGSVLHRNSVDPDDNNITGSGFGYRVLNPTTNPQIFCDNIGTMNVSCVPVDEDSTGTGAAARRLSAFAGGTATNTADPVSGSGTPTATLSASGTASATLTFTGTGAPSTSLSASGTGFVATDAVTAQGAPAVTLSVTADGDATATKDAFTAEGAAATRLSATIAGIATQAFSGSGTPTATLSATIVGVAEQQTFDGPIVVGVTPPVASTGDREVAWPGSHSDPEQSDIAVGDIGIIFIGSKNQTIPTLTPGVADSAGDTSSFATVTGTGSPGNGAGTAGAADAVRLTARWCRATSHHMRSVIVPDVGEVVMAGMVVLRGCIDSGDPWDVVAIEVIDPASTSLVIPGLTTTVADALILGAALQALDQSSLAANDLANASLENLTTITERASTVGPGGIGMLFVSGEKLVAGVVSDTTGTWDASTRSVGIAIALKPPTPPDGSTGSGTPAKTLSASVTATATQSASHNASGAPTKTLSVTAAGVATRALDVTGSGAPTKTLSATAIGVADSTTIGQIDASGSPVVTLSSDASGLCFTQPIILFPPVEPPPLVPGQGGRKKPKRILLPEEEREEEPKKTRRQRRAPRPVPEALPLPELAPPPPAFAPVTFDPMLWASVSAPPVRPQTPVATQQDTAEEEAFLAQLLDLI